MGVGSTSVRIVVHQFAAHGLSCESMRVALRLPIHLDMSLAVLFPLITDATTSSSHIMVTTYYSFVIVSVLPPSIDSADHISYLSPTCPLVRFPQLVFLL